MQRRSLPEPIVRGVLAALEQLFAVGPGRDVLQSRIPMSGKPHLVRVFVDVDRNPAEVVTAYRASRITKYWRAGS